MSDSRVGLVYFDRVERPESTIESSHATCVSKPSMVHAQSRRRCRIDAAPIAWSRSGGRTIVRGVERATSADRIVQFAREDNRETIRTFRDQVRTKSKFDSG